MIRKTSAIPSTRRPQRQLLLALLIATLTALGACSSPPPPANTDANPADDQRDRALLNAIEAPQNKARAVEADVLEAAQKQREQIDAATGD